MDGFHIHRTALAERLADSISPDPIFGAQGGLFLAAPRRTGKSAFLRRELLPLLEERGFLTIYVDLWADEGADPGRLIASAIADKVKSLTGLAGKVRNAIPFDQISIGPVSVSLSDTPGSRPATLTDALMALGEQAGTDVVFVIDEAQQALASDAGLAAMFALKAARDAMNQRADGARLYLIFTGSHRDKLSGLVLGHKQPFFGSQVTDFPKLGRDYVQAIVNLVNPRLAPDNQLRSDDVEAAFDLLGNRPQILSELIKDFALGAEGSAGIGRTVRERADDIRARQWGQFRSDYGALTELQRAVLAVLIEDGAEFAPFSEATVARIGRAAGREVGSSDVQAALDALREKSIVWRPARGIYALEDQDMRDWLLHELGRGGAKDG